MNIRSTMCFPLYNDMASALFGLYDSKSLEWPFSLSIVHLLDDEMLIFSSLDNLDFGGKVIDTKNFINENHSYELSHSYSFLYEPHIVSLNKPCNLNSSNLKEFFDKQFFESMVFSDCWTVCAETVYVIIYIDNSIKSIPVHNRSACEMVFQAWKEFYDNNTKNLLPPFIDKNNLIANLFKHFNISNILNTVMDISSQYYESSRGTGCISVTSKKIVPAIPIEQIPFRIDYSRCLRKILEMTRYSFSLLVHDDVLYGVGKPKNENFTFKISGHLKWDLYNKDEQLILHCENGSFTLPLPTEIIEWHNKIKGAGISSEMLHILRWLLDNIQIASHGALVIVTNDINNEVDYFCNCNMGIRLNEKISICNKEILEALTSIDGAVFVDEQGFCHGFGIILDGNAFVNGTVARGSRYNSANIYVADRRVKHIKVYAIVKSQDGDIDTFSSYDNI